MLKSCKNTKLEVLENHPGGFQGGNPKPPVFWVAPSILGGGEKPPLGLLYTNCLQGPIIFVVGKKNM